MKRIIITTVLSVAFVSIGFIGGWWANSPSFDILCSKPFVYTLGKNIETKGITINSGTEIDLRSCEYANRFTVSLIYDKGTHKELFIPKNSAPNIGNHGAKQYNISNVK